MARSEKSGVLGTGIGVLNKLGRPGFAAYPYCYGH
jgi:hypothetical protein